MNNLLTIEESAKFLMVCRRTFNKLKDRTDFAKPIKYSSRKIFYKAEDLKKWQDRQQR